MRNVFEPAFGFGIAILALFACKEREQEKEPWTVTDQPGPGRAYKLSVAGVEQCVAKMDAQKAPPGDLTVGFDVSLEATGDQPVQINPFELEVTDAQGHTYKPFFMGGCQPELDSTLGVKKNEKHRGKFSVHVPETTRALKVVFKRRAPGALESDDVRFQAERGRR